MEWSDHLGEMQEELERLERHSCPDEIHVNTRSNETHVNLVYEHSANDPVDKALTELDTDE